MRRIKPGGVGILFDELHYSGSIDEQHASTCFHCQSITEFPSMKRMMEFVEVCRGCMKLICLKCAGRPCRPWEKEVERLENEARLRAAVQRNQWGCY